MAQLHIEGSVKLQQHEETTGEKTPETILNSLPIIDLAGVDGPERETLGRRIAEACETWGFFHLINQGIDQSLLEKTKDLTAEFFHSPEGRRRRSRLNLSKAGTIPRTGSKEMGSYRAIPLSIRTSNFTENEKITINIRSNRHRIRMIDEVQLDLLQKLLETASD